MRKIARETELKRETVRKIAKEELGLRPYKLQKAHFLSEEMKKIRVERSRLLLKRHAGTEFLFSDEKIFIIEANHNHQNDRIWTQKSPF